MATNENSTHKKVVSELWTDLYNRDYDAVAAHFAPDGEYTDVASPADDVARGRTEIAARLRLGFEPLAAISHDVRVVVAEGDTVVTEHVEHWDWGTGERAELPFVSIHQFRDGEIVRWWDYWDMQTLMSAAPAWWVEHVMQGYR
jgi:ketosteroid isomerase-like protein